MCRADFSLPSITAEDAVPEKKAPIRIKFEIPYFTVSGIQVSQLLPGFHFLVYTKKLLDIFGLFEISSQLVIGIFLIPTTSN